MRGLGSGMAFCGISFSYLFPFLHGSGCKETLGTVESDGEMLPAREKNRLSSHGRFIRSIILLYLTSLHRLPQTIPSRFSPDARPNSRASLNPSSSANPATPLPHQSEDAYKQTRSRRTTLALLLQRTTLLHQVALTEPQTPRSQRCTAPPHR